MVSNISSMASFFFKRNHLLVVSLFVLLVLGLISGQPVQRYHAFIDWDTIVTLAGLLLITTAIKESGLFYFLAYRISQRINDERRLALFLIFASAVLAMFLTNDIALFIIIPLTLSLQKISGRDYVKFIIFEAIAVNVGSSLTAIGNPQNIFLWHQWGISFPVFIKEMAPLVLMMALWLFIFLMIAFPSQGITHSNHQHPQVDRWLFLISSLLFIVFIVSIGLEYEVYFLPLIFIYYLFAGKKIILKADWGLILLFIVIFIDLHLLYQLNALQHMFALLNLQNPHSLFLSGALLSQLISNVPAAILLAKYSANYKIIAYAVNIGGNGLLIGSFANLIALRFVDNHAKYWLFHKYSIPYLVITLFCLYYQLFTITPILQSYHFATCTRLFG